MAGHPGEALAEFSTALHRFQAHLRNEPALHALVFDSAADWMALLRFKLLPHLAGEGCLVVAVAGGTNTGKSTVFNLLAGGDYSPVRSTAAATSRPLLAANATHYEEFLAGGLMPEFQPTPLDDPESVVRSDSPPDTMFAVLNDRLPDRMVLLDTPDVDSIARENWSVAENIRAAGDVIIAVLTGEKYKDDRVVEFFRGAQAAGRLLLPLMNKANPENAHEVARAQLREFCKDTGLDGKHLFVLPHDFSTARDFTRGIPALDGEGTLRDHIESLDTAAIKQAVYRDTVTRFSEEAGSFLEHTKAVAEDLRSIVREFEDRAASYAQRYDPTPGAVVGGLFHEYVQSKRIRIERAIGAASQVFVRSIGKTGRIARNFLFRRTALERPAAELQGDELRMRHRESIIRITQDLAATYFETARNLRAPAGPLILRELEALNLEQASEAIVRDTLKAEAISDAFHEHAQRQLDVWWNDHKVKRRAVQALDAILMTTPWAIAGVMAIHTAGVGVPEMLFLSEPIVVRFINSVGEFQFGDALFDFITPWREEQQQALEHALHVHVAAPAVHAITAMLAPFDGDDMKAMRRSLEQCQN